MRADWDCCGVAMPFAVVLKFPGAGAGADVDVDADDEGLDQGSALAATRGDVCAVDDGEDTKAPRLSLLPALVSFLMARPGRMRAGRKMSCSAPQELINWRFSRCSKSKRIDVRPMKCADSLKRLGVLGSLARRCRSEL